MTFGAEIIVLIPLGSISHHLFLTPLMQKLIENNHNITFATTLPTAVNINNVTTVPLADSATINSEINGLAFTTHKEKPLMLLELLERKLSSKVCENLAKNSFIQETIKSGRRFDVVFIVAAIDECAFPVSNMLANSIVYVSFSRQFFPSLTYRSVVPTPYSFVPNILGHFTSTMDFEHRFWNALQLAYSVTFVRNYKDNSAAIHKYLPTAPSIKEAKFSLIFSNTDAVLSEVVPSAPWVIPIGGLHCRPAKAIAEQKLNEIVSSGPFILFSLGTVAELGTVGFAKPFIDAFTQINVTVLWKTKEQYPNLPPNVKTVNWISQQDVLGHKNIRLFITQGGIFGLQEAVYHGVPVLVLPLITDQFSNAARVEELGIGKQLRIFRNLTAEEIVSSIQEMMSNLEYSAKMKKLSNIFKDETENPVDRAMFWTEYLIRNGKNLEDNAVRDLTFVQYFLIDIIGLLASVVGVIALGSYCLMS